MTTYFFLEWVLRLFGVFWAGGSVFTLREAWKSRLLDKTLNALQAGSPEDALVTRFLSVSAVLTLISGVSLAFASKWSPLVVGLLVLSQVWYFLRRKQQQSQAESAEAAESLTISEKTKNAFIASVVVWLLSFILLSK